VYMDRFKEALEDCQLDDLGFPMMLSHGVTIVMVQISI
jgi:hypothetical protein